MTSSHQVPLLCLPRLGVEKRYTQVSQRALTSAESKSNKNRLGWRGKRKFSVKREVLCGGGCPQNLVEKTVGTQDGFI